MIAKELLLLIVMACCTLGSREQTVSMLFSYPHTSLRGLSVVSDRIIWVCGSNGTVGRSVDSGLTWQWMIVQDHATADFRDIGAFSENEALIMGTEPALILKTTDAGLTWKTVFKDDTKGMFLDAMDFRNGKGIVIGDPVNGKIFLAATMDNGSSWQALPAAPNNKPVDGEAFFAASGSNILLTGNENNALYVSGGTESNLYADSTKRYALPILQGKTTTGANAVSLSPENENKGIITGGDFSNDSLSSGNCILFTLIPFVLQKPVSPPHGYRSSVIYLSGKKLLACGLSGIDLSEDGGLNWRLISRQGFNVCGKAKNGKTVFLAGNHGTVAALRF